MRIASGIRIAVLIGLGTAGMRAAGSLEVCVGQLAGLSQMARASCLQALRNAGPAAATPEIGRLLSTSDGSTSHKLVAALLDILRSFGGKGAAAGETLSAMLSHRHPLYIDRDKSTVTRLRTYTFLTLSEIGMPAAAVPALLDVLAHFDVRMNPAEIGAAVRAAAALGQGGRRFVPYMLATLSEPISEDEFSLVKYEPGFEKHEATTVQIEVVRCLGGVAVAQDDEAMQTLRRLAQSREAGSDRRLTREARDAIGSIERRAVRR